MRESSSELETHQIAVASADPQSLACWTAPVYSDMVDIPMVSSLCLNIT